MTNSAPSPALRTPPAAPAEAAAFFAALLAFRTDVSDVHASLTSGDPDFVLVDSRGTAAWQQGRIPGARHLPTAEIPARAGDLLDPAVPVVTYCWGPGCDGATRAALALARLGYRVKEMAGGIEYWIREGFPVVTGPGEGEVRRGPADPLTAPVVTASPSAPRSAPGAATPPETGRAGRRSAAVGAVPTATAAPAAVGAAGAAAPGGEGAPGMTDAGEAAVGDAGCGC